MPFSPELVDELNVLIKFNLSTTQEGIKVHKTASPAIISATERLFAKGLITQADGGYLTPMGQETAVHAQELIDLLTAGSAEEVACCAH
ncbi:MAG: TIGR02647 family protein [Hahellaceae bacterium]|nr:TIGR02647 family protein [Hahellaceae bacterium]MCP5168984.1 TIGR02647 family protein [Hahellaceae bacterium]